MPPNKDGDGLSFLGRAGRRLSRAVGSPTKPSEEDARAALKAREVAEDRHDKFLRRNLEQIITHYTDRLTPAGQPVEDAIERLITGPFGLREEAPAYQESLVRLARKFVLPGEQVCGYFVRMAYKPDPGDRDVRIPAALALVFTGGVAIKQGGTQFRTDQGSSTFESFLSAYSDDPPESGSLLLGANVLAGEFSIGESTSFHGSSLNISSLYLGLRASAARKDRRPPRQPTPVQPGRPAARLIRTPRDADLVAAEWMSWLGFQQVSATLPGPDGGIDVRSVEAVAQVKAEVAPVGRPKVQQLHGVASATGKLGLFFSLAGYTSAARSFADSVGIALFSFDLQGDPTAVNATASALVTRNTEAAPRKSKPRARKRPEQRG